MGANMSNWGRDRNAKKELNENSTPEKYIWKVHWMGLMAD